MDSDLLHLIPKASTDINPGDVVVMPRKSDPVSISALGATPGRIEPIAAAREGQWHVGVAVGKFTSAAVGATLYATPTQSGGMAVQRRGIVRLAMTDTAGKVGDPVIYSSGASGAQLFVITKKATQWAVGFVAKDFSGATANDPQYVELCEVPIGGPNLFTYLENRVLGGCHVCAGTQPASRVRIGRFLAGTVPEVNLIILQNKVYSIAANKSLAMGGVASAASSSFRTKWVVARSASFGIRSGSGTKSALASFTVAGVTIGLLTPVTMTAGEFPIALLVQFSAANQSNARIFKVFGQDIIPKVGSWGL